MTMVLALVALAVLIGFGAYIRLAPSDPAQWHVDPLEVARPNRPNHDLMRPEDGSRADRVFAMAPEDLLSKLDAVARSTPRVQVLAGSAGEGHITYVARSAFWGFPDYISVKALSAPEGARLVAFSRARFGNSDIGVNAARMDLWLDAVEAPGDRG